MTHFARIDVINTIYERGIVPSFAVQDMTESRRIVKACADGGARVILGRIHNAAGTQMFGSLVAELAAEEPAIILGAGPIADAQSADEFMDAGAGFIVNRFSAAILTILLNIASTSF